MSANATQENLTSTPVGNETSTSTSADQPLPVSVTWLATVSLSLTSLAGAILYTLIFLAICRNLKKFKYAYYKFLVSLGVAEVYTLFYNGFYGTFCVARGWEVGTSADCPIPRGLDRFLASLAWVTFYCEYTIDLLIAFDRFVAVVFPTYDVIIFSNRSAIMMCIGAWMVAFVLCSPIVFWFIPSSYVVGEMVEDFELWATPSMLYNTIVVEGVLKSILILSFMLYVVSLSALVVRWRKKKSIGIEANSTPQKKLLIQGSLRFSTLVAYGVLWELMREPDVWVYYASAMLIQAMPLNTTIITISLNGDVREEIVKLLKICSPSACKGQTTTEVEHALMELRNRRDTHTSLGPRRNTIAPAEVVLA